MAVDLPLRISLFCLTLLVISMNGVFGQANASELSASREPRRFILSIGIGDFQDQRWRRLSYAEKDAKDIYDALRQSFTGGLLLTKSELGRQVTRQDIAGALAQLKQQIKDENDTVLVYFSGHGTLALAPRDHSKGFALSKFLITADTKFSDPASSAQAFDDLLNQFQNLISRRKALIVDSCYAGGGKAVLTPQIQAILNQHKSGAITEPDDPMVEGSAIYTASAWSEEARENDDLQNGVYTHFLLKGFDSDLDGDGAVTLSEAHHYASNRVTAYTGNAQHPTARIEFVGRDPIVVKGNAHRAGQSILYAWQWAFRRYQIFTSKSPLGSLEHGALIIPEGRHELQVVDPEVKKVILKRYMTFQSGRDYSLTDLFQDLPRNRLQISSHWFTLTDSRLKQGWSPKPWAGVQIQYQKDELLKGWDGFIELGYLESRNQRVTISLNGLDDRSEGQVTQNLIAFTASVGAGDRTRIPRLSFPSKGLHTYLKWNAGVGLWQISRDIMLYEGSADKEEHHFAGVLGRVELLADIGHSSSISIGGQSSFTPNVFSRDPIPVLGISGLISLGVAF